MDDDDTKAKDEEKSQDSVVSRSASSLINVTHPNVLPSSVSGDKQEVDANTTTSQGALQKTEDSATIPSCSAQGVDNLTRMASLCKSDNGSAITDQTANSFSSSSSEAEAKEEGENFLPIPEDETKKNDSENNPNTATFHSRRCLWEVNHEMIEESLTDQVNDLYRMERKAMAKKWNFDSTKEVPLEGNWEWVRIQDYPSFFETKDYSRQKKVPRTSSNLVPNNLNVVPSTLSDVSSLVSSSTTIQSLIPLQPESSSQVLISSKGISASTSEEEVLSSRPPDVLQYSLCINEDPVKLGKSDIDASEVSSSSSRGKITSPRSVVLTCAGSVLSDVNSGADSSVVPVVSSAAASSSVSTISTDINIRELCNPSSSDDTLEDEVSASEDLQSCQFSHANVEVPTICSSLPTVRFVDSLESAESTVVITTQTFTVTSTSAHSSSLSLKRSSHSNESENPRPLKRRRHGPDPAEPSSVSSDSNGK